jgi:hypothetical protein
MGAIAPGNKVGTRQQVGCTEVIAIGGTGPACSRNRLGVAWRYSRRNTTSVARREAVARLDEFVGLKY